MTAALAVVAALTGAAAAGDASKRDAVTEPAGAARAAAKLPQIEDFAPPEEFVTVDGVKTHFVRKGGAGRPVVFVHGFGSATHTWQKAIDALSARYRVFALDLRGFGLTAKPKDGQYHMESYTRHLLGFFEAMALEEPPVLVGHSLGGAVVTRLALLNPGRVGALLLEDPVPVSMPRVNTADLFKRAGVALDGAPKPGTAAETATALNPMLAKLMLPTLLRSTVTRQTVENGLKVGYHDPRFVTPELVEVVYRPLTIEGAAEALASMMNPPPAAAAPLPALESLRLPTLVVWGRHDRVLPVSAFKLYADAIPGAARTVFAESGHVPHEEESAAFNARLLEFLDSLP